MDLFNKAKTVRLRSHHDKYLVADDDEESVCQDRNGSSRAARWTVEYVQGSDSLLRLKSCYGLYLTASNVPFLLGVTGRKVLQTNPRRLDSSVEWEPIREGFQVKLKTRYGHFLRANGGLPPWRNSVTHDIPHRTATQDWVLWDVDIVEVQIDSAEPAAPVSSGSASSAASSSSVGDSTPPRSTSFSVSPSSSPKLSKQELSSSLPRSPRRSEGRMIHYHIADDDGELDEDFGGHSFVFKGSTVQELTHALGDELGLEDVIVCTRSPLNGKLYPLRLHLPPNNTAMNVVVVQSSSKVAKSFVKSGLGNPS